MKKILVTGSDGFVGTHLCTALRQAGYSVSGHCIQDGDISVSIDCAGDLDWVFHLAALTSVEQSWLHPELFYQINVLGTVNVLELCRKKKCGLTFISSYVYGTPHYSPIDEDHPTHANSPYNHSKLMAEEACRFYHETFSLPVVVFRPFNIYGPGQSPDFLVPTILKQIVDPEVKEIRLKSLTPTRDLVYIDDVINALVKSIGAQKWDIFNLGSGALISVQELAQLAMDACDIHKPLVSLEENRKNEVHGTTAAIQKAWFALGWKPETTLRDGLKRTFLEMSRP